MFKKTKRIILDNKSLRTETTDGEEIGTETFSTVKKATDAFQAKFNEVNDDEELRVEIHKPGVLTVYEQVG
jgi:hypothetical protein